MISSDFIADYIKVVKFYKIKSELLSDVVAALVVADTFNGSNRREMDIDRFYSSILDSDLRYYWGITNIGVSPALPDIQVKRVMCDSLFVCLYDKNISGVHLVTEEGNKVANALWGSRYKESEYGQDGDCDKMMKIYLESCVDSSGYEWVESFDTLLSDIASYLDNLGTKSSVEALLKGTLKDVKVPVKSKYLPFGTSRWGAEEARIAAQDNLLLSLEVHILTSFNKALKTSQFVAATLWFQVHLAKVVGTVSWGTVSSINACASISASANMPNNLVPMINRYYKVGKSYSMLDLPSILVYYTFYIMKVPPTLHDGAGRFVKMKADFEEIVMKYLNANQ